MDLLVQARDRVGAAWSTWSPSSWFVVPRRHVLHFINDSCDQTRSWCQFEAVRTVSSDPSSSVVTWWRLGAHGVGRVIAPSTPSPRRVPPFSTRFVTLGTHRLEAALRVVGYRMDGRWLLPAEAQGGLRRRAPAFRVERRRGYTSHSSLRLARRTEHGLLEKKLQGDVSYRRRQLAHIFIRLITVFTE